MIHEYSIVSVNDFQEVEVETILDTAWILPWTILVSIHQLFDQVSDKVLILFGTVTVLFQLSCIS